MEVYEGLPGWSKGVVIVGGLTIVTIVGFAVYNKIKSLTPSQDALNAQQRLNQVTSDLNAAIANGQQPTFASTQYNNYADSIASAFSGCDWTSPVIPQISNLVGWSTSASTVYNIVKAFNNDVDMLALQKAFGIRTISKSFICGGDYTNVDLAAAVNAQCNQVEIAGINDLLSQRNISYRF